MSRIIKVSVNLPESDVKTLKRLAATRSCTVTTIIRQAIAAADFLQEQKDRGARIWTAKPGEREQEVVFR